MNLTKQLLCFMKLTLHARLFKATYILNKNEFLLAVELMQFFTFDYKSILLLTNTNMSYMSDDGEGLTLILRILKNECHACALPEHLGTRS